MAETTRKGFDFSDFDATKLDFEAWTGSRQGAAPFRNFERLADAEALAADFPAATAPLKRGAREQLAETVTQLERSRAIAEKVYEARQVALESSLRATEEQLSRGRATPRLQRRAGRFQYAAKLREEESGAGLPNLIAEVVAQRGREEVILAQETTDAEGNFVIDLLKDQLPEQRQLRVRFRTAEGQPLPELELDLACRSGRAETAVLDLAPAQVPEEVRFAARRLGERRNERLEHLQIKRDALAADREATLAQLDRRLARNRELLAGLEEELAEEGQRYLGNSNSFELHDLDNEQPGCQIAKITDEHRVPFASVEEALEAGYDRCAYCFGAESSKR